VPFCVSFGGGELGAFPSTAFCECGRRAEAKGSRAVLGPLGEVRAARPSVKRISDQKVQQDSVFAAPAALDGLKSRLPRTQSRKLRLAARPGCLRADRATSLRVRRRRRPSQPVTKGCGNRASDVGADPGPGQTLEQT